MEITAEGLVALRQAAEAARSLNYSPYSGFLVLAAARTVDGAIGAGSNVENVNFSLTKHAEEVAVLAALQMSGQPPRLGLLEVVYVAGAMPCGSCRQFTLEFGGPESLWIVDLVPQEILTRERSLLELPVSPDTVILTFGEALPAAFGPAVPGIARAGSPAY